MPEKRTSAAKKSRGGKKTVSAKSKTAAGASRPRSSKGKAAVKKAATKSPSKRKAKRDARRLAKKTAKPAAKKSTAKKTAKKTTKPAAKKSTVKKAAKPAAKKTTTKKAAKPAAKKAVAKKKAKPAAKKPAVRKAKPAAKKPAAKKTAKPAAKKAVAKKKAKPAAKKPAVRKAKPAAKKPAAKKTAKAKSGDFLKALAAHGVEKKGPAVRPPFPAYKGTMPYIFVSYSHTEMREVFPIIKKLNSSRYRIWFDEGIEPGNEWPEVVGRAVLECSQFMVFMSPTAVDSRNVRNEINLATSADKNILVIYLQDTSLSEGLLLQIGTVQYFNRYEMTEKEFIEKLKHVLNNDLHN